MPLSRLFSCNDLISVDNKFPTQNISQRTISSLEDVDIIYGLVLEPSVELISLFLKNEFHFSKCPLVYTV